MLSDHTNKLSNSNCQLGWVSNPLVMIGILRQPAPRLAWITEFRADFHMVSAASND
jgi:hypothetical protein